MPPLQTAAIRHASPVLRYLPRTTQKRWAQVHDVRFLATRDGAADRVYEKYKTKLDKKARLCVSSVAISIHTIVTNGCRLGMRSVDDLKKAYRKTNMPTHPATDSQSASPLEPHKAIPTSDQADRRQPSVADAASNVSKLVGVKTLASFLDVEKTMELPPREIESLWRLRHATSPWSLCATIPASVYRKIETTAKSHPQFILPLAREGQGAEIHFMQWTFPSPNTATVLFTHLAEYKLRGEFAQPHTTVTHHLDMADSKGLVLLEGLVTEGRGITADEARTLLMYLQKFYGMDGKGERVQLLRQFSSGDQSFKIENVIEEAEKII